MPDHPAIGLSPDGRTVLRRWLTEEQTHGASERHSLLKRRVELLDAKFAGTLSAEGDKLLDDVRADLDAIASEERLIPIALALLDAYEEALREQAELRKRYDQLYRDYICSLPED